MGGNMEIVSKEVKEILLEAEFFAYYASGPKDGTLVR